MWVDGFFSILHKNGAPPMPMDFRIELSLAAIAVVNPWQLLPPALAVVLALCLILTAGLDWFLAACILDRQRQP
jgi:hypothetical protein